VVREQDASQKADAPHPEHEAKPDSPTDIEKPSWKYVFRKTVREFSSDQCIDIAAALVYYSVLALFPALLALFSLLGLFGQSEAATRAILGTVEQVAPDAAAGLEGPLQELSSAPGAGLALVLGIVLAIWSASGYVGAFTRAMNRIYEIEEGRTFFKLKPAQLLVTLIGIIMILIMTLLLVISGPVTDAVGEALGLGATVRIVWEVAKWPVIAIILILMIAILYYATPNAKQPKFRWMSIGAFIALLLIVIAGIAFGIYIANFSNYDRTYGSLAGVIIFLLLLWIVNLALLFGAEFDAELERGRQLQAGIEAEETIQLPPRDTKKSDKAAKKEEEDLERGRALRLDAAEAERSSEKQRSGES
jgi:membrane protein